MDAARHPSEEADGSALVLCRVWRCSGYRGLADQVAATIVVTLKEAGVADGRPFAAPAGVCQDVRNIHVAILPEIHATSVTAVVHIVGQRQQLGILDDERVALGAVAFGEDVLIVVPLTIEIGGAVTNTKLIE